VAADFHVIKHGHGVKQADGLKGPDHAPAGDIMGGQSQNLIAVEKYFPPVGRQHAAQQVEGGCFAGAVGADDGAYFVAAHVK